MEMTQTKGKVLGISQNHKRLMMNQQNMTKMRHETWCEKTQTYNKSNLPEEPTLKLGMNLDIKAYAKHTPPSQCTVQRKWKDSLVDNKQFEIILKKSTADMGAQYFLLRADHLPDLGLSVEDLLQSEINLNCANSTMAGNLGVFYAKIRGEHWECRVQVHGVRDRGEHRARLQGNTGDVWLHSKTLPEGWGVF